MVPAPEVESPFGFRGLGCGFSVRVDRLRNYNGDRVNSSLWGLPTYRNRDISFGFAQSPWKI